MWPGAYQPRSRMPIHHDSYLLATFGSPRQFAAWLRCVLPPELAIQLDWDTLRRAGERHDGMRLRVSNSDLVYAIDTLARDLRLLAFPEHRSHDGHDLHDTMLRYAVHLLHAARRELPRLPTCVLGLVISHGLEVPKLRPRVALELTESVVAPWLPFQPMIQPLCEHWSPANEAQLLARPLPPAARLAQVALAGMATWDHAATLQAIARWAGLLREVAEEDASHGSAHLESFFCYVLQANSTPFEDLQMAIQQHLREQRGTFMSTAEKLRTEGRVAALRRLLERRFGPLPDQVLTRLHTAGIAELDCWLDRVLDADSVDAVFA